MDKIEFNCCINTIKSNLDFIEEKLRDKEIPPSYQIHTLCESIGVTYVHILKIDDLIKTESYMERLTNCSKLLSQYIFKH